MIDLEPDALPSAPSEARQSKERAQPRPRALVGTFFAWIDDELCGALEAQAVFRGHI